MKPGQLNLSSPPLSDLARVILQPNARAASTTSLPINADGSIVHEGDDGEQARRHMDQVMFGCVRDSLGVALWPSFVLEPPGHHWLRHW